MGKRALLNLWLAAALLALVWVVWQEPGHAPKPAAVKLTALMPAQINKVVINNHSGTISLSKQGADWEMLEPVKIAANAVRVDDLLQLAQADSLSRFPATGKDLVQYGLDKPVIRVRLNDTELLFGGVTPVDRQRYVKLGDTIHTINDRYLFDVSADAAAFVSRDLVPKDKTIVAVTLPDTGLTRDDKGEWTMTPANKGMSQEAAQHFIEAWRDAQAVRVTAYDKRPQQGEVVIQLDGDQPPLHYGIIERKPELILARPDVDMQFYLAAEQADRLLDMDKATTAAAATDQK